MSFASEVLSLERNGHVATLWLDRPEARNAMGRDFWSDLPRAMTAVTDDDEVRAVVIAARGPHFSVGLDMKEMGNLLADPGPDGVARPAGARTAGSLSTAAQARTIRAAVLRMQAAVTSVAACPKPVVAAIHGYCIGGGVDVISACDIRLAAADAVFSVRETRVAIVADLGSLQRLPRIVGAGHVAELAYTGKDVDAPRAREIGLVNEVHPDAVAVLAAARAMAGEIAANSPLAVQGTKAVLAANDGRTVGEGLEYVATWNAGMLASDDLAEAMGAFTEKRAPRFTGR